MTLYLPYNITALQVKTTIYNMTYLTILMTMVVFVKSKKTFKRDQIETAQREDQLNQP